MDKFGRNYQLFVENADGTTQFITLPTTIEFDIIRNNTSAVNACQIRIYNLSLENRNNILFNRFNGGVYRNVLLRAGYGNNLSTIFAGNYNEAWSYREGVNYITQIEAYDGGYALVNGDINLTFPAGTPYVVIIQTIINQLPFVSLGAIGNFPGVLPRANTYQGNPVSILYELTNGGFFIDHEKAYALNNNDYIPKPTVTIISPSTGLLGTPLLEQNLAHFDMLLEASLGVGDLINIQSTTTNIFTGFYKTCTVKHRGTISGVVAGTATTSVEFQYIKVPVPATITG